MAAVELCELDVDELVVEEEVLVAVVELTVELVEVWLCEEELLGGGAGAVVGGARLEELKLCEVEVEVGVLL